MIVWIARKFRDEHREALDLLNRRTGEDTEFFGIEVELWKIDDSRPAVNFNLVATPNEWRKQTVSRRQCVKQCIGKKGEIPSVFPRAYRYAEGRA